MLLKNKTFVFVILALLASFVVSAEVMCEVTQLRVSLKKALYDFLTDPASSTLSADEVRDFIIFYLNIPVQTVTINCSETGVDSGVQIDVISTNAQGLSPVPTCSDGTNYGSCSLTKPGYCFAGTLVNKCETCGCPAGEYFCSSNSCIPTANITCNVDSDCGTDGWAGSTICLADGNVHRDHNKFWCLNPSTPTSYCHSNLTMPTPLIETCPNNCRGGNCCRNGVCIDCTGFIACSDYGGDNYLCTNDLCFVNPAPLCGWNATTTLCFDAPIPEPDSCSDTDSGLIWNVTGTASGYLNDQPYSDTDYCQNNATIVEYYCVGDQSANQTVDCLSATNASLFECLNGACI